MQQPIKIYLTMKHLLQLLLNLIVWFILTTQFFFEIFWYGKLPKVSMYHLIKRSYDSKDVYNNKNCQVKTSDDVPNHVKSYIINDYIDELFKDDRFKNNILSVNIPIFDGKEVVGNQGVLSILNEAKSKLCN